MEIELDGKILEIISEKQKNEQFITIPHIINWKNQECKIVSIGDNVLNKSLFEEITIEEGINKIGDYAFSSCTKLNKINIPNSVKKLVMKLSKV